MRTAKLVNPTEPLTLPDGKVLRPSTHATFDNALAIPSAREAVKLVSSTRRKLAELPALPKQMNAYAVVLVYTASGLSDAEIAIATGFDISQIKHIRSQQAYAAIADMVIEAAKAQAASVVTDILAEGEVKAATKIVALTDSIDEKIALAASKDVLDRRGHKAADKIDIMSSMEGMLRIEIVDKRDDGIVIDMEQ